MNYPEELKYTKKHEWVKIEGNRCTVGITDYAQNELGDIVFVDLPPVGTEVEKGKSFGVIESVKAVSDIYSPVSGTIAEVNLTLEDEPELVNKEPYGNGWMAVIEIGDLKKIDDLLESSLYEAYVVEEERKK